MADITEEQIRNNAPIALFTVNGVEVSVPILCIAQADEWRSSIQEISILEVDNQAVAAAVGVAQKTYQTAPTADKDDARKDLAAAIEAHKKTHATYYVCLKGAVADYLKRAGNTTVNIEQVTWPQLFSAFNLLYSYTDPTQASVLVRTLTLQAMKNKIKGNQ